MPSEDDVTSEKINAFFKTIGVGQTCPICQHHEFYYQSAPTGYPKPLFGHVAMIPSYSLICAKCGFIRQHARLIIDHPTQNAED